MRSELVGNFPVVLKAVFSNPEDHMQTLIITRLTACSFKYFNLQRLSFDWRAGFYWHWLSSYAPKTTSTECTVVGEHALAKILI